MRKLVLSILYLFNCAILYWIEMRLVDPRVVSTFRLTTWIGRWLNTVPSEIACFKVSSACGMLGALITENLCGVMCVLLPALVDPLVVSHTVDIVLISTTHHLSGLFLKAFIIMWSSRSLGLTVTMVVDCRQRGVATDETIYTEMKNAAPTSSF